MRRTLRGAHRHGLGGEHVAHLARADPEGDGAEGAVGRGVTVAAGDRHTGLGQSDLGAHHMHNALVPAGRVEELDPVSRQLRSSSVIIASASGSDSGRSWESVGMMWSTVA